MTEATYEIARWIIAYERAQAGGDLPDAMRQAVAKLHTLTATLVGDRGFGALVARAVHLTRPTCPWLEHAGSDVDAAQLVSALAARIGEIEAEEVERCVVLLLGHVLGLLCSFIGDDLTFRLVRRTWPDLPGIPS